MTHVSLPRKVDPIIYTHFKSDRYGVVVGVVVVGLVVCDVVGVVVVVGVVDAVVLWLVVAVVVSDVDVVWLVV